MTVPRLFALSSLALLCACSSRKVDVNMGAHRVESLRARAEKSEGSWTMDMELPSGRWTARLLDDPIIVRVVEREGRLHARFDLPEGRIHDGKPVRLGLQGVNAEGSPEGGEFVYQLSARYPMQKVFEVLFFFNGGPAGFRQ